MPAPSDQTPGESPAFSDLALNEAVLKALQDVGYESPSPIQAATIPHLLAGSDVVGQAQTGTGKTAAFALPILSKIDVREAVPQALVLVPTRELAIQVAEAFQRYATYMKGFHVLPVYGGQSYTPQLQSLRRGVHVIVATPGRAMDHIKRGTLNLSSLKHLVLDEADEMLRMGFIDDVEWILEQIPAERQIALFSATMPTQVRRIAQQHLRNPAEVTIKSKTTTASKIRQRYLIVGSMHAKLDALTRILEAESFDAMIVFARTKIATEELAQKLAARGFAVEALNGDIAQVQRERTIARLKSGQIDIVVATDVAARGLDVERVSHVVNFDVPYDPESYVHRIGRTGRAGRSGEAILFIAPRERNMLRVIERTTRQDIEQMQVPSVEDVNERRVARFNEKLASAIETNAGQAFLPLIESYERDNNVSALEIAAALASIAQGATPLLLEPGQGRSFDREASFDDSRSRRDRSPRPERGAWSEQSSGAGRSEQSERPSRGPRSERSERPARGAWSEQSERGPRSERAEYPASGARTEQSERSDRGSRSEQSERPARGAWSEQSERPSRGTRYEKSERPSRGAERSDRPARAAWKPSDGSEPAGRSESGAPDFTSSEQSDVTSPPQPRPLNRRERRALEFAQREGQAPAAEGEAAPGAIKSDSAEIGNVEAGSAELGNFEASNVEAGVDVSNAEAGAAEAGATETGSEDAAAKPRAAKRAARDGERSERPSESRRPREFAGRSEGSERPTRSRGDDEGRPSRPRSSEGEGRFARGPGGDDDRPRRRGGDEDVETYRIEVGHAHGVKPGNIVGAIANEAGLEGNRIGRVTIRDDHSFVDLPAGMPKEVFQQLQKVRVAGQQLQLSRALKTHVEKLRRERPSAPKFRANVDSKAVRPKSRSARDTPRRR